MPLSEIDADPSWFWVPVVNLIMRCFTSISFAVLINGPTSNFFKTSKGLRQGCPLAPLLFFIVTKGLSRASLATKRSSSLKGILIGNSLQLSHLLFVDDVLLFCDGSWRDAYKLKEDFDLYCIATSMKVNMQKSSISFHEVEEDQIRMILQRFHYQKIEFEWV